MLKLLRSLKTHPDVLNLTSIGKLAKDNNFKAAFIPLQTNYFHRVYTIPPQVLPVGSVVVKNPMTEARNMKSVLAEQHETHECYQVQSGKVLLSTFVSKSIFLQISLRMLQFFSVWMQQDPATVLQLKPTVCHTYSWICQVLRNVSSG